MTNLIRAMEKHGHLELDPAVRKLVLAVSAATIDRLLTPVRQGACARRRRHVKKRVSRAIPIKAFSDWQDPTPGFLEIDFVVPGGGSMAGEYLHSLVVTDVCSWRVEAVPLIAREQHLVIAGLDRIREQLPVVTLGMDSDNDGAFINNTLATYCQEQAITFTRSRPVQNPSAFVFIGDGRARSKDLPYYASPTKGIGVQHCWVQQFSARHNAGGNLMFADGHVTHFKYAYVGADGGTRPVDTRASDINWAYNGVRIQ